MKGRERETCITSHRSVAYESRNGISLAFRSGPRLAVDTWISSLHTNSRYDISVWTKQHQHSNCEKIVTEINGNDNQGSKSHNAFSMNLDLL